MPSLQAVFPEIAAALADHYGQVAAGRPAGSFEAILAAVLDRAPDAAKVRRVLDGLRDAGLLEPEALAGADLAELADVFRQARVSPTARLIGPLGRLARWYAGRSDSLDSAPTEALRQELLAINGIGPATADSILLHGLGRPVYPVDRASYRVLVRHGWIDPTAEYDEARDAVERAADADPLRLAEFAAWMDRLGAQFCRASVARCDRCPLRGWLPEGGPIEPTGDVD